MCCVAVGCVWWDLRFGEVLSVVLHVFVLLSARGLGLAVLGVVQTVGLSLQVLECVATIGACDIVVWLFRWGTCGVGAVMVVCKSGVCFGCLLGERVVVVRYGGALEECLVGCFVWFWWFVPLLEVPQKLRRSL